MHSTIRVVADADGGDHAPQAVVEGVLRSRKANPDIEITLVGTKRAEKAFNRFNAGDDIGFIRVERAIAMDESPATIFKTKQDSSIIKCSKLVSTGEADAMFSAGNSGAVMAAALLNIGRLKGVNRPALPVPIPNIDGGVTILLDAGANSDCKPFQLLQFAAMGIKYSRALFNIKNPRLGLLNIGKEKSKGNTLTLETYGLLEREFDNFTGNVEGNDIFRGEVDVLVSDGFVGNVSLKIIEGTATLIIEGLKREMSHNLTTKIGAWLMQSAFNKLFAKMDYQEYGGSPLLGIKGICVIGHGISSAAAVCNGIRLAADCKRKSLNEVGKDVATRR